MYYNLRHICVPISGQKGIYSLKNIIPVKNERQEFWHEGFGISRRSENRDGRREQAVKTTTEMDFHLEKPSPRNGKPLIVAQIFLRTPCCHEIPYRIHL